MSRKIYLPVLGIWEDVDDVTLLQDVPRVSSDGALIDPATGNTPAAGDEFHVFGGLGRIRVQNTGDSSETFTLTYYLRDGTTDTATETLAAGYDEDWPINALGLDHLTWASTGTGASVETY